MNRITNRSWIVVVLALALVAGSVLFVWEFVTQGPDWVYFSGSPHVYDGLKPEKGVLTDRNGVLLLNLGEGTYATDSQVRRAMLHWTGDRQGNIATPLLSQYLRQMTGFDLLNGVYAYADAPGVMELTLSAKVQTAALEALGDAKGTVAVYNYKTGQILCAVSTPSFDPDDVPDVAGDTSGIYDGVYLNRFTQVTYTPGSIFKLVTTAVALETIPDILRQDFTCTGVLEVGGGTVTCERAHGTMGLYEALANSCNCTYANIAQQIGGERLQRYAEAFGITGKLSFDGYSTAAGSLNAADASLYELSWAGIGQHTDLVNPCQFLSFVGAIANGGAGTVPHVVDRITVGDRVTYRAEPERMDRIMSADTARILREMMRNNVEEKYGDENFPDIMVCAKSGTAEMDGDVASNALFTGFVMDEEYPLAFIVVVQEGGYGSHTGMPIINKVLTACMEVLDEE